MHEVERLFLKALVGTLRVIIDQIDNYLDSIAVKPQATTPSDPTASLDR